MNALKVLVASVALCISAAASAETFDLQPSSCGFNTYGSCFIYKDPATEQAWYLNWTSSGSLTIRDYHLVGDFGLELRDTYGPVDIGVDPRNGVTDVMLADTAGNVVRFSGEFNVRRSCVRVGRGQHCTNYVTFLGGTLVTQ